MAGLDQNAMLVEGIEDEQFVKDFLNAHQFSIQLQYRGKKGYSQLRKTIPTLMKESGIKNLGVIADADTDFAARWQSISDVISQLKYPINRPNQNGVILTHNDPMYPKLGIWIMPNNLDEGMLEDFAVNLIPDNKLLGYVDQCIENLPEKRFIENHMSKARIHTWLAWQKEPGSSIGLAVTRNYLNKESALSLQFLQWLKDLYQD